MEIWFYHLTRDRLEQALPTLLERSLARGWKAVVQARSDERIAALDDLLWTYADASFLPHGRAGDGNTAEQPILLTTRDDAPNGAQVRFFVEGADVGALAGAPNAGDYERLLLLFDGNDADELASARAQWKALKDAGHTLAYWRQGEEGGWERAM